MTHVHVTNGWDVLNTFAGTIPQICTAIGVIIVGYWAHKATTQNERQLDKIEIGNVQKKEIMTHVKAIELRTNGITDKLVKDAGEKGHVQGVADERLAEHGRVVDAAQRLEEIRGDQPGGAA